MSMRCLLFAIVVVIVGPVAADEISGEEVFNHYCIPCHADSKEAPGTIQLRKRRGAELAVLAERDDLVDAYVEAVVRNGLNAMPAFTPSDLDEDKLKALVKYLANK